MNDQGAPTDTLVGWRINAQAIKRHVHLGDAFAVDVEVGHVTRMAERGIGMTMRLLRRIEVLASAAGIRGTAVADLVNMEAKLPTLGKARQATGETDPVNRVGQNDHPGRRLAVGRR